MSHVYSTVLKIAGNECSRVAGHPLVIITSLVLFIFAVLNGLGGKEMLVDLAGSDPGNVIISTGLGQVLYSIAFLCTIVAVFVGAMSVVQERSKSSLLLLLTKPLYRRDIIAGKFLGLSLFMLVFIALNVAVNVFMIVLFFQAPVQTVEFLFRIFFFILVLFIECSLSLAIMMLAGVILQDLLKVALVAVTYVYLEWFALIQAYIGWWTNVSPRSMFFSIVLGSGTLLDTSIAYTTWLGRFLPQILLMVVLTVGIFLLDCVVFARRSEP
ncbi:MAG: ABC transporter permease subunit [Methanocella sp.]